MADKDTGTGFAIGFVVGAVIGLGVGFLYAPRPGKETRQLVKEKAGTAKERAGEIVEEARERAKKIITDARGKAAEIKEEGEKSIS